MILGASQGNFTLVFERDQGTGRDRLEMREAARAFPFESTDSSETTRDFDAKDSRMHQSPLFRPTCALYIILDCPYEYSSPGFGRGMNASRPIRPPLFRDHCSSMTRSDFLACIKTNRRWFASLSDSCLSFPFSPCQTTATTLLECNSAIGSFSLETPLAHNQHDSTRLSVQTCTWRPFVGSTGLYFRARSCSTSSSCSIHMSPVTSCPPRQDPPI